MQVETNLFDICDLNMSKYLDIVRNALINAC